MVGKEDKKMKKRKMMVVMAMLLFSAVSILFVSCQEPVQAAPDTGENTIEDDGSLIEAYMTVIDDKAVTVSVPSEVHAYQYKAIPLFSVEQTEGDGTIFGTQLTWRNFAVSSDGKRLATMGYYRQGYWRFEIRTLNKQGQVLATGTTQETGDIYLQKGKDNIIAVTLHTDDGEGREGENESTGQIVFAFETNWLSDTQDKQYIRLEVDKLTTTGDIDNRDGYHDFTFPLQDGTADKKPYGTGWAASYSTAPGTVTGYQDGWSTVLPTNTDKGVLATDTELGFAARVPEGRIRFYAKTPNWTEVEKTDGNADGGEGKRIVYEGGIAPGNYIVRAKVCTVDADNKELVIGGQSIAVRVVGGEVTYVAGSLLLEKYQKASLSITLPDNVKGSMSSSDGDDAFVIKTNATPDGTFPTDKYINLTFTADVPDIDYSRLTFQWRENGSIIQDETGRTLKYTPKTWGDMKITCIVTGKAGDTNNLGEVTSATMVVRVIEESGPNI